MAMKSFQELYDLAFQELQAQNPELTDDSAGSILDTLIGVFATAVQEAGSVAFEEFKKTYISTANGPDVTGGPDDLQTLLVDHFGDEFARPEATKAVGTVAFSRANTDAGDCEIPAGTIVKTTQNAAGNSERFEVLSDVTLTALTINASVRAMVAGVSGNAAAGKVVEIESALTDSSVTVTNADAFSGGAEKQNDEEYRQTAYNLLQTLRGATLAAIKAAALSVAGIETATATEFVQDVIEWDTGLEETVGESFKIARVKLYVADANGVASQALIDLVEAEVLEVRAAGVQVEILGATAVELDVTMTIVLDSGGPNYAEFSTDTSRIVNEMTKYIQDLDIGEAFSRAAAKNHILALWGSSGTGDLTNLSITSPTGDVSVDTTEKLIPGTVSVE